jgi:hypothetical protein
MRYLPTRTLFGPAWLSACVAIAQGAVAQSETPNGLLLFGLDGEALAGAPRLQTGVEIRVSRNIARARVRQRFVDPADTWAEGVCVFPLPDDASVDRLCMLTCYLLDAVHPGTDRRLVIAADPLDRRAARHGGRTMDASSG